MLTIQELKELKETAVLNYEHACNIQLIQFIKTVTDIYKYRLQVSNIDSKGSNGIIWHDDNIESDVMLLRINEIVKELNNDFYIYVNYENKVKWQVNY